MAQYRFEPTGGSIIDWASVQSGLADPLTRFSRHDLGEYFKRFEYLRDRHLGKVRKENLSGDPKELAAVVAAAPEAAREALRRLTRRS